MQHVFHLPKEYSFEKVGIKGKTFGSKILSDKVEFTIIETKEGHETKIREKKFAITGSGDIFANCRLGRRSGKNKKGGAAPTHALDGRYQSGQF